MICANYSYYNYIPHINLDGNIKYGIKHIKKYIQKVSQD